MKPENRNILILFVCLISLFLMLNLVSAINTSSPNYSVGRFGTGLATTNASSENYQATSITEVRGTTRNAESDSFFTNVGFFSDTSYHRTVIISSYSVSPKTAYTPASIGLYISALNYKSIWANITRPDSVVERVELTNNDYVYYTASILGTYNITFYASGSDGSLSSVIDHFYIIKPTGGGGSSGGGGGSSGGSSGGEEEQKPPITPDPCTYIWDCTPWSVCKDGKHTRECKNIGDCKGTGTKPIEEIKCSETFFDILLNLSDITVTEDKTIIFKVNFTEMRGVEKINVLIKYSIINEEGYEVFSQIETKAVEGKLEYEKKLSDIKLLNGEYTLKVDALYGNLQRSFAEEKFRVVSGEIIFGERPDEVEPSLSEKFNYKLLFMILGLILILILILIIIFSRRKSAKERGEEAIKQRLKEGWAALDKGDISEARKKYKDIKSIYNLIDYSNTRVYNKVMKFYDSLKKVSLIGIIILFPLLFAPSVLNKLGFTGNFIGNTPGKTSLMFILVLSFFILFLLVFSIGQLTRLVGKKIYENSISSLISKQVYSSNGYLIGKVKEVILKDNKIHSLVLDLDKKYNSSKGIVIEYKAVKNIKSVVIIDEKVIPHLPSF